jgi:hypothetical protein
MGGADRALQSKEDMQSRSGGQGAGDLQSIQSYPSPAEGSLFLKEMGLPAVDVVRPAGDGLRSAVDLVQTAIDLGRPAVDVGRRTGPLDTQYEEIFSRARRQLESIALQTSRPYDTGRFDGDFRARGTGGNDIFSGFGGTALPPSWQRAGQPSTTRENRFVGASPPISSPPRQRDEQTTRPAAFEQEALALQAELAQMQRTLQDRLRRYSVISSQKFT